MPDRLLSLVVLVGAWVPPAAAGFAAAEFAHGKGAGFRPARTWWALTAFVVAWAAAWFFYNLGAMPPYIPGATRDPIYPPAPEAVRGLLLFTGAVVLPVSAVACLVAYRWRGRVLRTMSPRA